MKLVRIREAKPIDGYRVQLTLTDGRVIERDLGSILNVPVFSRDPKRPSAFSRNACKGGMPPTETGRSVHFASALPQAWLADPSKENSR